MHVDSCCMLVMMNAIRDTQRYIAFSCCIHGQKYIVFSADYITCTNNYTLPRDGHELKLSIGTLHKLAQNCITYSGTTERQSSMQHRSSDSSIISGIPEMQSKHKMYHSLNTLQHKKWKWYKERCADQLVFVCDVAFYSTFFRAMLHCMEDNITVQAEVIGLTILRAHWGS